MRTFSHADWHDAQQAWADGEFSDEWRGLRHTMAMQGCIFPPSGTRFDSWEDDQPSQRAMLIRAIRETPELLAKCSRNARSWTQLIKRLVNARDEWREEMRRQIEDDERPIDRRAPIHVGALLPSVADALGLEFEP